MTVTYTNDIKTNILDPLRSIIFGEFKPLPVEMGKIFDASFLTMDKYIRYWFLGSDKIAGHSDGETREYRVEVVFYFSVSRSDFEKAFTDNYSPDVERLKRVLENNTEYNDGTYRWHTMGIEIEELQTVEEMEDIEDEETIGQRFIVTITRSNFRT